MLGRKLNKSAVYGEVPNYMWKPGLTQEVSFMSGQKSVGRSQLSNSPWLLKSTGKTGSRRELCSLAMLQLPILWLLSRHLLFFPILDSESGYMRAGRKARILGCCPLPFSSLPELILARERALQPKLPEGWSTSKQVPGENDKSSFSQL